MTAVKGVVPFRFPVRLQPLSIELSRTCPFCSQVLAAWGDLTRDELGHLQIVAGTSRAEAFHDAHPILHFAVLAHLPLAFEPRDGKAETYDAPQHDLYVIVRRI